MIQVRIKEYHDDQYAAGKNIIGELYEDAICGISDCWREATNEEAEWYKEGAKMIPKYEIGEELEIISVNEFGLSKEQLGFQNLVKQIKWQSLSKEYSYDLDIWHALENQVKLVNNFPKYFKIQDKQHSEDIQKVLFELGYSWSLYKKAFAHTHKPYLVIYKDKSIVFGDSAILEKSYTLTSLYNITEELRKIEFPMALKEKPSFDKDNFYVYLPDSENQIEEYKQICKDNGIKYVNSWRGCDINVACYGVCNKQTSFYQTKKPKNYYTFKEFKSIFNNKHNKNEVLRTNSEITRGIDKGGTIVSSRRQRSSIKGRLEGHPKSSHISKKRITHAKVISKVVSRSNT